MHTPSQSSLFKKLLAAALPLGAALAAHAQVTISFVESGSNVVATFSGTLQNLPTLITLSQTTSEPVNVGHLYGQVAGFGIDLAGTGTDEYYTKVSNVTLSGSVPWNQVTNAVTAGTTNAVGVRLFSNNDLYYYSRTPATVSIVSGTATFLNTNLSGLGFAPGAINSSGSFSFINGLTTYETINWNTTGAAAIPEPSTYAALAGVAALGLAYLKRRKADSAS